VHAPTGAQPAAVAAAHWLLYFPSAAALQVDKKSCVTKFAHLDLPLCTHEVTFSLLLFCAAAGCQLMCGQAC
jgi:hypothetical protein